ncbi:uncharacterized protein LOC111805826 [Cucurbita pepo subsp. pepo]|uniref:uncharacterized protein LOC111805826 n=1 Tax=Cucurbita pepo subsp. pepo TaxID=3664 RepID=UPI000C9D4B2C|nr:uncharacterized protein LOC111805826 [Cucurbita pepo subsp. pepo]
MAADGLLRPVYEACIAGCDTEIDRRPYHRNCGCALHKSRRQSPRCSHSKSKSIFYPIRRSWSEGCLALALASASSSPSSSPVIGKTSQPGVALSDDDDDDAPLQLARN